VSGLGYLAYTFFYSTAKYSRWLSVIQSLLIIGTDVPLSICCYFGYAVPIALLLGVNLWVTILALQLSKLNCDAFCEWVCTIVFKCSPKWIVLKDFATKHTNELILQHYYRSFFSFLAVSKATVWFCGVFYGQFHEFSPLPAKNEVMLVVMLLWLYTGWIFLYYACVCAMANIPLLTIPFEPILIAGSGPIPHIIKVVISTYHFNRIRSYAQLCKYLRNQSQGPCPNLWLVWLYDTLKANCHPPFGVATVTYVVRNLVRRYVAIFAMVKLIINPLVLVGSVWIKTQPFFPNLEISLDTLICYATSGTVTVVRRLWDAVPLTAAFTTVAGFTVFGVWHEMSGRWTCLDAIAASAVAEKIAAYVNTPESRQLSEQYQLHSDKLKANITIPEARIQTLMDLSQSAMLLSRTANVSFSNDPKFKAGCGTPGILNRTWEVIQERNLN
jgi:hypothetical protein